MRTSSTGGLFVPASWGFPVAFPLSIDKDLRVRIGKASNIDRQLAKKIFKNRTIAVHLRLQLLGSLVLSTIFSGAGCWIALAPRQFDKLNDAILSWQRQLAGEGHWATTRMTDATFQGLHDLPPLSFRLCKHRLLSLRPLRPTSWSSLSFKKIVKPLSHGLVPSCKRYNGGALSSEILKNYTDLLRYLVRFVAQRFGRGSALLLNKGHMQSDEITKEHSSEWNCPALEAFSDQNAESLLSAWSRTPQKSRCLLRRPLAAPPLPVRSARLPLTHSKHGKRINGVNMA